MDAPISQHPNYPNYPNYPYYPYYPGLLRGGRTEIASIPQLGTHWSLTGGMTT